MNKRFFLAFFALIILSCVVLIFSLSLLTAPLTTKDSSSVKFHVERGDTTIDIATNLSSMGLIRSPLGFRYVVKRYGLGPRLQAGTYSLSPTSSTLEIANQLTRGIDDLTLTIPEGYRLEEIAKLIDSTLSLNSDEFLTKAKDLEGYLFPDTYYLSPTTNIDDLLRLMQTNFQNKVGDIDHPTLILASLIERETAGNAEKPIVAGILTKRLSSGWTLELDATVQYVLGRKGEWWPNTTLNDRKIASTYNTYLIQGLPPTPICNPGLASIDAARSPEDSPYWFYLHSPDGQIHYGATLEEHNQNIDTYLR